MLVIAIRTFKVVVMFLQDRQIKHLFPVSISQDGMQHKRCVKVGKDTLTNVGSRDKEASTHDPSILVVVFSEDGVVLAVVFFITDIQDLQMKFVWVSVMKDLQEHVILIVGGDFGKVRSNVGVNPSKLGRLKRVETHRLQDQVEFAAANQMTLWTSAFVTGGVIFSAILFHKVEVGKGRELFDRLNHEMREVVEASCVADAFDGRIENGVCVND